MTIYMPKNLLVSSEDMSIVLPQCISASPQAIKLRIEVINSSKDIVGVIEGIVEGNMSIDATSDVRRTCSFSIMPTFTQKIKLDKNSLIWIDRDIRVFVSLYNVRTQNM